MEEKLLKKTPVGVAALDRILLTDGAAVRRTQARSLKQAAAALGGNRTGRCDVRQIMTDMAVERGSEARSLQVVAFSDPSDLLSYEVGAGFAEALQFVQVKNVVYPLAWNFLGVFANPDRAHSGYDKSEEATALIACGATLRFGDRPEAKNCRH